MSDGQQYSTGKHALLPGTILVACIIAMGVGAEWVNSYIAQATDVMINPNLYIEAVLKKISP